ncbi:hypothetical protein [Flammeovirga sp. SubArs3]|uniref:hypothetical protein n=1 Tax=Flammeovirga sp. SubArs3 TaxID=2995316 RepID=UPI00248CD65F|nr:hypothetical protein [Flammeovirga sp. SubArs3]
MRYSLRSTIIILSTIILSISCATKDENENITDSGTTRIGTPISYSRFVALGDGVTAGLQDNVWYKEAQDNSVAGIFSQVISQNNLGPEIINPKVTTQGTGIPAEDSTEAIRYSKGSWIMGEARILSENVPSIIGTTASGEGFTNISVIGAKFNDFTIPSYKTENPYFAYFSPSDTASMFGTVVNLDPTFTLISAGRRDILDYAIHKYTDQDLELPDASQLGIQLENMALPLSDQKGGAMIGIDFINEIPFFNHMRNSLELTEETATALNNGIDEIASGAIVFLLDSIRSSVTQPVAEEYLRDEFILPILVNGWDGELGIAAINTCNGYDMTEPGINKEQLPLKPSVDDYPSSCSYIQDTLAYNLVYNKTFYTTNWGRRVSVVTVPLAAPTARTQTALPANQQLIADYIFAGITRDWVTDFEADSASTVNAIMSSDPLEIMVIETAFKMSIDQLLMMFIDNDQVTGLISNQLYKIVLNNVEGTLTPESLEDAIDESIGTIVVALLDVLRGNQYFPEFVAGTNPFIVLDPTSPTRMRQLEVGDKIMLPYANVFADLRSLLTSIILNGGLPADFTVSTLLDLFPTADMVYDVNTQEEVAQAVQEYNLAISSAAKSVNWAYVDVASISTRLLTGYKQDGNTFTTEYRSGNFYSMDGLSYTSSANAIIVNELIDKLNTLYRSTLPKVKTNEYTRN